MTQSQLEATFETRLLQLAPDAPTPEQEYRFHPKRRWRFDFAWPDYMLAVELEGGTHTGGRHVRSRGYAQDCHKYNAAVLLGWRVLRFTSDMLENDPINCIGLVVSCLDIDRSDR